jgi:integrase
MAKRRGNLEGSIFKRKDGRWVGEVTLSGKRLMKYTKTQKEARDWVNATLGKIDHGLTFDGAQLTLSQYLESWLAGKDLARRPSTVRSYRRYMDLYILPALGRLKLQSILPMHVRQLYVLMQSEGKGARTIQLVHVTLHCAFAQAVKEGLVGYNPMDAIERPKVETKRYDILIEEQRIFRSAIKGHPLEALFFLALTTSMRKGEILGLMWTDVDWEKHTLRVERQLQPVSFKTGALVPTKTKAGRRAILIGPQTMALLKEHREKQERQKILAGDCWQEHGMIFTTSIKPRSPEPSNSSCERPVCRRSASMTCAIPRSRSCWRTVRRSTRCKVEPGTRKPASRPTSTGTRWPVLSKKPLD